MTEPLPTSQPTVNSTSENPKSASASTVGVRPVAKRVFGWTCNLLATVLVLTAALVFTRQVLYWWQGDAAAIRAERETAAVLGSDGVGLSGFPIDMELGSWPCSLKREEFTGDRKTARARLRQLCEASAAEAQIPTSAPGPAEEKMLAGLVGHRPFATLAGGCQLFELDGPVPLVAAVKPVLAGSAKSTSTLAPTSQAGQVATSVRRVVSWGLGVHLAGTRWTLLLLTAQTQSPVGDHHWAVLLPPGARRSLSLAAVDRESIVAFVGSGPRESWQQYYDKQLAQAAAPHGAWQLVGDVWQQRYETASTTIEVQLASLAGSDEIQGLLTIRNNMVEPARIDPQ